MSMDTAAAQPARGPRGTGSGAVGRASTRPDDVTVRRYVSVGVSVTLIDGRPDEDGFGHVDADALLLRHAARWIDERPGVELTGIHAGYDPLGRRQLVVTVEGDVDAEATGRPARLASVPEPS